MKLIPNSYQTPNALIDDLLTSGDIDAYEFTLLSVIIRKTCGWHKLEDCIAINQFCEMMPKISRSTIIRKLKNLIEKELISTRLIEGKDKQMTNSYSLGEKFSIKKKLPDEGSVTEKLPKINSSVTEKLPEQESSVTQTQKTGEGSVTEKLPGSVTVTHTKHTIQNTEKLLNFPNGKLSSGDDAIFEKTHAAIPTEKPQPPQKMNGAELVKYFCGMYAYYFRDEYIPSWQRDGAIMKKLFTTEKTNLPDLIDFYLNMGENKHLFWSTVPRTVKSLQYFINDVKQAFAQEN